MKIAVLFNPGAGKREKFKQLAGMIRRKCEGHTLLTAQGSYGADLFESETVEVVSARGESFLETLGSFLEEFASRDMDMLIGVGGDGFLAHIASHFIVKDIGTPLLGIAGGTANVGPLISFDDTALEELNLARLRPDKVSALLVRSDGEEPRYAFNDIVVGDTFLGTVGGKMVNLSAEAFLKDWSKLKKKPSKEVVTEQFEVVRNGFRLPAPQFEIAQIVASPIVKKEFYSGKAITGALCWAAYNNCGGALSLIDTVVIDSSPEELERPVNVQQILFKEGEEIEITGLKSYLVVDGNVCYKISSKITIGYLPDMVVSLRPADCR